MTLPNPTTRPMQIIGGLGPSTMRKWLVKPRVLAVVIGATTMETGGLVPQRLRLWDQQYIGPPTFHTHWHPLYILM